jgi:ABC-type transport system involved in multi-copper enzyme maturation permease subunit
MAPQDVGKVAVDMALSTISLSGILVVLFVGINLMAKDLDRRTIYMVLAKPISRQEYILGKFLGMMLILLVTTIIISLFSSISLVILKAGHPDYFPRFSWSLILLGIVFIVIMLTMLLALSFLFASFSSTSFITLVLTIMSYIIGHSLSDVKALVETPRITGEPFSPVVVALVRVAYYLFPNLSFFDIKTRVAHGLSVLPSQIAWTLLYGAVYTALAITAAALIFRKKEFP